jgi:hypothetical protein
LGSAYSSRMPKYESPVTVFSKKKNGPINLSCIKLAHTFTLGPPLSNSHMTCGFWLPQILHCTCLQLHWHGTSPRPHSVLVYESFESRTPLGGAFCVAYHVLLLYLQASSTNWFAWTLLECLSNATDVFFRGLRLSRRFYMQQTPCSPQSVVPQLNIFPCRRLMSILCPKTNLDNCKRLQLCQPQHALDLFLWCRQCYWACQRSPAGTCA